MFSKNNDCSRDRQAKTGGTPFLRRCYRLDRSGIALLRFLVEGYDGLLFLRTLDAGVALVEFAYAPASRREAEAVLAALAGECVMTEIPLPPPGHFPPL